MRNLRSFLMPCSVVAISIAFTGCIGTSYAPNLYLEAPSQRINANLNIEDFSVTVPAGDSEKQFLGSAASDPESMPSDLGVMLTNEIVKDFRINDFFSSTSKMNKSADVVLTGQINRFKAKHKPLPTAVILFIPYVNLIAYFGIPLFENEVIIGATVTAIKPNGDSRSYTLSSEYDKSYNIYRNGAGNLSASTNRSLNNVIRDLREQMIEDASFYED